MKRMILAFLFLFLIFGMLFGSVIVLAKERGNLGVTNPIIKLSDSSGSRNSDLSINGSSDSSVSGNDDNENSSDDSVSDNKNEENATEIRDRIKEKIRNSSNVKKEFSKNITASNGNKITIQREVEVNDGETKIKIKKVIVLADGTKRTIEIEIERDENGTTKEIQIEGKNVSINKDIEINDLFEGNDSELEAILSDGNKTKIKVLPEQASEIARQRLKAMNISNLTLEEIKHKNIPRVVYNIETNQNGRFLGIFKLAMKSETQIDPETGEVLSVSKPWWAFLVSVPEENIPLGNETSNQTNTTNSF